MCPAGGGRLPAQRLRPSPARPAPCWCASLRLSVSTAWQPKVQVLTCACPLASRAACRPHGPSVQSAPFGFSVPALLRAVERIFACPVRFRGRAARPSGPGAGCTLYTAGPGPDTKCLGSGYPPTDQSRVAQHALVRLDSLPAFARPAPLRLACLPFGFVDADLPDSRCRRCRQSVEPANHPSGQPSA